MFKFKDAQYVVLKSRNYFDNTQQWAKIGQIYKIFISDSKDGFMPYIAMDNEPAKIICKWYLYGCYEKDFDFACPYQEFEEVEINLP